MTKHGNIAARIKVIFVLVFFVAIWLARQMYNVQIERHDELLTKAKHTYTTHTTLHGKRGQIYDKNGHLLVGNIPVKVITADPTILKDKTDRKEIAKKLAKYFRKKLGLSKERATRIYKELQHPTRINDKGVEVKDQWMLIARDVDFMLACQMEEELKKYKLNKAIIFTEQNKRHYPKQELLANVLGFTNSIDDKDIGMGGLERRLNISMSSQESQSQTETTRMGIPLSYGLSEAANIKNGNNVYLTIEEPIQAIVEEELDKLMEKWKPRAAYAVMADPYTGNILAMAQRPTFNPNDRSTYTPERYRNRITEDTFEPGSTMKPIAISRAIDDQLVTPDTRFDCEKGYWYYGGARLKDSHENDMLTVAEIIQTSSNIGTAKIALKMGNDRLYDTLTRFGFTERTGIPLKNETKGLLRPLKKWYKITPTRVCIGQSINTSPLQLVRGYCALANHGILPELRLVDRIEDPNTGEIGEVPIGPRRNLYKNSRTHKKMIDMMKLVTQEGGTATNVAIDGYYVAGKTGTSQKYITGQGYSQSKFFATFIGFVPADNPKFVLLVTADEPKKSHYGGTVAGPTFKSIAEKTLKYYNVQPDYYRTEIK